MTKIKLAVSAVLLLLVFDSFAQSPAPFRLAINYAFSSETNVGAATIFSNFTALGVHGARHTQPSDANWLAVQSRSNAPFVFTNTDVVFTNAFGVMPIAMLYEDPNAAVPASGLQVPWLTGTGFNFTSNEWFYASNYVRAVVTHYTNVTHLWEISNEVSGTNNRPASLPAGEFAWYLATNWAWIHATDPQAQVLLPGCLGSYGLPVTNGPEWLRSVLTNLATLGQPGFDIMNYHDYKYWWGLPVQYDAYAAVLAEFNLTNVPIWITESACSSTNNATSPIYAGADQQAADVWRRSCVLFGKGAAVFCWHSLYSDAIKNFAHQGLLEPVSGSTPGKKKKSWHSFRLLAQKIEGFQSAILLANGNATTNPTNGGQGQWVVRFDWSDGTRRFVAWSGTNLNYTLTNLSTNPYRLTTVVPTTISSNGEDATFTITTNTPVAGSLTLTCSTNFPVLIESTVPATPVITNTTLNMNLLTLSGTGPSAENYSVLATTNVTLALSNWTRIGNSTFSNSSFHFTDSASGTNNLQRFYRISTP